MSFSTYPDAKPIQKPHLKATSYLPCNRCSCSCAASPERDLHERCAEGLTRCSITARPLRMILRHSRGMRAPEETVIYRRSSNSYETFSRTQK